MTIHLLASQLKSGNFGDAIGNAKSILKTMPDSQDRRRMQNIVGALAYATGDYRTALATMTDTQDPEVLLLRAKCHIALGEFDSASRLCLYVKTVCPDNEELRFVVASGIGAANRSGKNFMAGALHSDSTSFYNVVSKNTEALQAGNLGDAYRGVLSDSEDLDDCSPYAFRLEIFGGYKYRWDGSPIKHLVIFGSAGNGDVFQFARFIEAAAQRCERITLAVPDNMLRLFQGFADDVISLDSFLPALQQADAYVDMMLHLPAVLGRTDYASIPYISANSSLPVSDVLRIGICWSASPQGDAAGRSLTLRDIEALKNVPLVEFHSLIPGKGADWMNIHHFADWRDTASLIAGLDVVISVDTAVAHLAGAMGKPTWIILKPDADWRWGTHPTESRWYPTAKLFRRRPSEPLTELLKQIEAELLARAL